ncbi:MAG: CpXC domain-containing protein [Treponematales bacterium]
MKRKITCFCENVFEADVPDEIDLDSSPAFLGQILDGSFMTFVCPSCGKKHKPEFPLVVTWVSRNLRLEVLPELDRGEFYRRRKEPPALQTGNGFIKTGTVIGYPEMADRLAVVRDGLEPAVVEALKYYLHLKADESYPGRRAAIWYAGSGGANGAGAIEFHVHGIKENEVAVTKVPRAVYDKTAEDYRAAPSSEVFASLRVRGYLSVYNTMRPEKFR